MCRCPFVDADRVVRDVVVADHEDVRQLLDLAVSDSLAELFDRADDIDPEARRTQASGDIVRVVGVDLGHRKDRTWVGASHAGKAPA